MLDVLWQHIHWRRLAGNLPRAQVRYGVAVELVPEPHRHVLDFCTRHAHPVAHRTRGHILPVARRQDESDLGHAQADWRQWHCEQGGQQFHIHDTDIEYFVVVLHLN